MLKAHTSSYGIEVSCSSPYWLVEPSAFRVRLRLELLLLAAVVEEAGYVFGAWSLLPARGLAKVPAGSRFSWKSEKGMINKTKYVGSGQVIESLPCRCCIRPPQTVTRRRCWPRRSCRRSSCLRILWRPSRPFCSSWPQSRPRTGSSSCWTR